MRSRHRTRFSLAGLLGLMIASACITQQGGPWRASEAIAVPVAAHGAPSLVVLGELGASGPTATAVAKRLEASLARERAAGRTPIVLWLGESGAAPKRERCSSPSTLRARRGPDALLSVLDAHADLGGAAFAVDGESATRCPAVGPSEAARLPFEHPAPHYVVGVGVAGETVVTLACTASGCTRKPGPPDPVAELVFVDIAPWIITTRSVTDDPTLRALDHLMDALEPAFADSVVPRVLVSHYPVEAAGYQGLGGGDPDSTIRNWPPRLGQAIVSGAFVGALGSHDRSTYATPDLAAALKRADRVWIPSALFQVVSGSASAPDGLPRNAYRRLRYLNGITYVPPAFTPRAGFAVVRLDRGASSVSLHARHGRRWKTAKVPISLAPGPKPALTVSPSMASCLRCPETPYSEQP